MSDHQDGGIVVDDYDVHALRERGALIQPVPEVPLVNDWHTALIALAEDGNAFPFRLVNTDDEGHRWFGMWTPNDAGHAHVCSVHPDDRGALAWEIGIALADDDMAVAGRFVNLVRDPCPVRYPHRL